jgi:hypothetical protein
MPSVPGEQPPSLLLDLCVLRPLRDETPAYLPLPVDCNLIDEKLGGVSSPGIHRQPAAVNPGPGSQGHEARPRRPCSCKRAA